MSRALARMKAPAAAHALPAVKRARGRPAQGASVDRETLLRNARKTFAKHGYEATSVREIARVSGVDAALLAHHFGSKDALWEAVVVQIAEHAAPMIAATDALRTSPFGTRERVERAIAIYIDKVFSEPDIGLFFATAATEEGARLDLLVARMVRPYHDVLVPLLADAGKQKALKVVDAEVLFFMLLNGISKTVAYGHLMRVFSTLPEQERKYKRVVLETALGMLG
ncbi:TetR/AcrR family transcriptional regulator [Paraburkholderia acidisoli]|nr:TetR/AcrR family transcriptional regulator [Paraburkholderia acidisoli]